MRFDISKIYVSGLETGCIANFMEILNVCTFKATSKYIKDTTQKKAGVQTQNKEGGQRILIFYCLSISHTES
jgi:hypothetical protein